MTFTALRSGQRTQKSKLFSWKGIVRVRGVKDDHLFICFCGLGRFGVVLLRLRASYELKIPKKEIHMPSEEDIHYEECMVCGHSYHSEGAEDAGICEICMNESIGENLVFVDRF